MAKLHDNVPIRTEESWGSAIAAVVCGLLVFVILAAIMVGLVG
jgi:hypothetical protein